MENIINNILKINFKTLPLEEKLKIKKLGGIHMFNLFYQDKVGAHTFALSGFMDVIL